VAFFCAILFLHNNRPRTLWPAPVATTESIKVSETSSLVDLDIYIQRPDSASPEEPVALTLITLAGQPCRQGTTKKGHLRWNEVARCNTESRWVAPGFERAIQEIDAHGEGEVKVIVQLRPRREGTKPIPSVTDS